MSLISMEYVQADDCSADPGLELENVEEASV